MKLVVHGKNYLNSYFILILSVSAQCTNNVLVKEHLSKPHQFDIPFLTTLESFDEEFSLQNDTGVNVLDTNASSGNRAINVNQIRERRSSRPRRQFRIGSNQAHRLIKHLRSKWHHHLPRRKANFVDDTIPITNYEKHRNSRYYRRNHIPDDETRQYFVQRERNYPRRAANRHRQHRIRIPKHRRPKHFIGKKRNFRRTRYSLEGTSHRRGGKNRWRDYRKNNPLRQSVPRDFFEREENYRRSRIGHHFFGKRNYHQSRNRRLGNYRRRHLSGHGEPETFFTKKTDFSRGRIKLLNGERRYKLSRNNMHKPDLTKSTSGPALMRIVGRISHHFNGGRKYNGIRNRRLRKYHRSNLLSQREAENFTKKGNFRRRRINRLKGERSYHFSRTNKHVPGSLKRNSKRGGIRVLGRIMMTKNNKKRKHLRRLSGLINERISSTALRRMKHHSSGNRRIFKKKSEMKHMRKGLKTAKSLHYYSKNLEARLRKESQKEEKKKFEPDCEIYKRKLQEMGRMVNRSVHKSEILAKIIGQKFGIDEKTIDQILRKQEKNIPNDLLSIF